VLFLKIVVGIMACMLLGMGGLIIFLILLFIPIKG